MCLSSQCTLRRMAFYPTHACAVRKSTHLRSSELKDAFATKTAIHMMFENNPLLLQEKLAVRRNSTDRFIYIQRNIIGNLTTYIYTISVITFSFYFLPTSYFSIPQRYLIFHHYSRTPVLTTTSFRTSKTHFRMLFRYRETVKIILMKFQQTTV